MNVLGYCISNGIQINKYMRLHEIKKKIKTERNTLHFQVVRLYGIGFEDFKKYQRLRDYIEANIKPLINNLSLEFQKLRRNRNSLA